MSYFFSELTLDKIYKLNIADNMFIQQLGSFSFNEDEFFSSDNHKVNLDFIIKIAHANKNFESMCHKSSHQDFWQVHYSLLGSKLISLHKKQTSRFNIHSGVDSFDMLRGAYFYFYAYNENITAGEPFTYGELKLLEEGIKYKSIHCIQRYNEYIYNQSENSKLNSDEKINLLKKSIINCKTVLHLYGSYAYMMLAEAYYRYGRASLEAGNIKNFSKSCDAAIESCQQASQHLTASAFSIHNASLGGGLQHSNSLGFSSPEEAASFCIEEKTKGLSQEPPVSDDICVKNRAC